MKPRVKIFIDGTWLWHNLMSSNSTHQQRYDLGRLQELLVNNLGIKDTILSRTIFCASIPSNVARVDEWLIEKRKHFFTMLEEQYNFQMDIYSIDFQGRRVKKSDRDPKDKWKPREKCVDIALISNLFYYQNEYDIAIVITGDRDFLPAFEKLTSMGKEIKLASFQGSCSLELSELYPILWLDDLLSQISF